MIEKAPIAFARHTQLDDSQKNSVYLLSKYKQCAQELRILLMNGARTTNIAVSEACASGNIDAVSLFIYMGFNIHKHDKCLYHAVSANSLEVVKLLLENNVNISQIDGECIGKCLAKKGGTETIKYLCEESGIRTNDFGYSIIYHMLSCNDADIIRDSVEFLSFHMDKKEWKYFMHYVYSLAMTKNLSNNVICDIRDIFSSTVPNMESFPSQFSVYSYNEYFD
jgi:hypothetical protein